VSQIFSPNPAGTPIIPFSGPGGNFLSAIAAGTFVTTSTTFQTLASIAVPALNGSFRVGACVGLTIPNANTDAEVRLYDATAAVALDTWRIATLRATVLVPVTWFRDGIVMAGAAKLLQLQYRRASGPDGVQATDPRLEFWRQ